MGYLSRVYEGKDSFVLWVHPRKWDDRPIARIYRISKHRWSVAYIDPIDTRTHFGRRPRHLRTGRVVKANSEAQAVIFAQMMQHDLKQFPLGRGRAAPCLLTASRRYFGD